MFPQNSRVLTVTLNPALDRIIRVRNFRPGHDVRADGARVIAGGKGVNVARALTRLGVQAQAIGVTGGLSGQTFIAGLIEEKIPFAFVQGAGEVRINFTLMDPVSGQVTRIIEEGPNFSVRERGDFLKLYRRELETADVVVLSGSLPPGAPAGFYAELIRLARKAGRVTALDTSDRFLAQGIKARPDIVKPNREEAEAFLGVRIRSRTALSKALHYFMDCGMKKVMISLGAEGLAAFDGNEAILVTGPRVRSGHAVGCGDAALAGFLAALSCGKTFVESLRQAAACGAVNMSCEVPGGIDPKTVVKFLDKIKVERL